MLKRKFFYYVASLSFVGGAFWGFGNAHTFLPDLIALVNKKPVVCLTLPETLRATDLEKHFLEKEFEVRIEPYEGAPDPMSLKRCETLIFSSEHLPLLSHQDLNFGVPSLDISKISPDFLGLSFDRLNTKYLPVAYWLDPADSNQKIRLHLMLVTGLGGADTDLISELMLELISPELQRTIITESKFGTVLRDDELAALQKISTVRSIPLQDLVIVKE